MLAREFVDYLYNSLWLILPRCEWMRLSENDRIRLCSQKFATWKSLRLQCKITSWWNDIACKLVVSRPRPWNDPDLLYPTPSTNLFCELRESPQSPQERCATVRTSCAHRQEIVFACYKFPISDCRGDWNLGLCTFWVLAKREPLSKSDLRKKNAFRPQEK